MHGHDANANLRLLQCFREKCNITDFVAAQAVPDLLRIIVKYTDNPKSPSLKSTIVGNRLSQVSGSNQSSVPDPVYIENALELIPQIGYVVAHPLFAELTKMGQVLAYLR